MPCKKNILRSSRFNKIFQCTIVTFASVFLFSNPTFAVNTACLDFYKKGTAEVDDFNKVLGSLTAVTQKHNLISNPQLSDWGNKLRGNVQAMKAQLDEANRKAKARKKATCSQNKNNFEKLKVAFASNQKNYREEFNRLINKQDQEKAAAEAKAKAEAKAAEKARLQAEAESAMSLDELKNEWIKKKIYARPPAQFEVWFNSFLEKLPLEYSSSGSSANQAWEKMEKYMEFVGNHAPDLESLNSEEKNNAQKNHEFVSQKYASLRRKGSSTYAPKPSNVQYDFPKAEGVCKSLFSHSVHVSSQDWTRDSNKLLETLLNNSKPYKKGFKEAKWRGKKLIFNQEVQNILSNISGTLSSVRLSSSDPSKYSDEEEERSAKKRRYVVCNVVFEKTVGLPEKVPILVETKGAKK